MSRLKAPNSATTVGILTATGYRNNIQIYTEMASTDKHSFAVPRIIGGTYTVKAASNAVKVTT